MRPYKRKVNNFDSIARIYDLLTFLIFGMTIQRSQIRLVENIKKGDNVLIVGGGTGWILPYILARVPGSIQYVDASKKMIALARKKVGLSQCPVNFIHKSIQEYQDSDKYDVVITFFVLDLFAQPNLNAIMHKLKNFLKEDGHWLFADFKATNVWQQAFVEVMYKFFKITCNLENTTLPSFTRLFDQFKLRLINADTYLGGMIQSNVYASPL